MGLDVRPMTTPNPTPTTREREAARELARQVVDYLDFMARAGKREGRLHYVGQLIAAALARERREALTEAFKECEAIARSKIIKSASHDDVDWNKACRDVAIAIRAAAIEALREKP